MIRNNTKRQPLVNSLLVVLILTIVGFVSGFAHAESVNFAMTVTDEPIIEISLFNIDGSEIDGATSMNITPSLFAAGFNEKDMVINVTTSNEWGYNLIMNVPEPELASVEGNKIANLAEKEGGYTCSQITASDCDFTTNSWGFRIRNSNTLDATNYIPVPKNITLGASNVAANNDRTQIAFGSRIDAGLVPGIYTTSIIFAATANPVPFDCMPLTICYDGNGADEGIMPIQTTLAVSENDSNFVDSVTPITQNASVALDAPDFKRDNYGFVGWSEDPTATPTNGKKIYGPNEQITFTGATNTEGLTLYAIWLPSSGVLQNWTGCSGMSTNDVVALTDSRDNNTYLIAKLADDKCWMAENLRLDSGTYDDSVTIAESLDSFDTSPNAVQMNNFNTVGISSSTTREYARYSYGIYYSWAQAVNSATDTSNNDGNADDSICPQGWRLPGGGYSADDPGNEFGALNSQINENSFTSDAGLRAYPANYVRSGGWGVTEPSHLGYHASFWTRTASYSTAVHYLGFDFSMVLPGTITITGLFGFSVRCVTEAR